MKCIDLFAGAGGLSCGLRQAGFTTVLANELVPQYAETYQHNHREAELVVGDIKDLCERDLRKSLGVSEGQIDLVAGGPPCQGFSINAPIRTLDDPRNHLFKDFLRVVRALLPKAVMIENVPGIVSLGKGTVVEQIYRDLNSMGYKVDHRILFAAHYGVPQMRFRTVIIGIKGAGKGIIEFPKPTYYATAVTNFAKAQELCLKVSPLFDPTLKEATSVSDAISDLPEIANGQVNSPTAYRTRPETSYQQYLRSDCSDLSQHHCAKIAQINVERLRFIPQGGSWRDIPLDLLPKGLQRARRSDHTKRYGRLHPDSLCSTVLTKCDPHWGSFFHPTQERVISVREAARIQSFPDSYEFKGSVTQQYEQIGNAVPPLLARAVGETIRTMIGE